MRGMRTRGAEARRQGDFWQTSVGLATVEGAVGRLGYDDVCSVRCTSKVLRAVADAALRRLPKALLYGDSFHVLTLGTGTVHALPPLEPLRYNYGCCVPSAGPLAGQVAVVGGASGGTISKRVDLLTGGEWRAGPALPGLRRSCCAVADGDGSILLFGGYGELGGRNQTLDSILRLPTGAASWETIGTLLVPRFSPAVCRLPSDGRVAPHRRGEGRGERLFAPSD